MHPAVAVRGSRLRSSLWHGSDPDVTSSMTPTSSLGSVTGDRFLSSSRLDYILLPRSRPRLPSPRAWVVYVSLFGEQRLPQRHFPPIILPLALPTVRELQVPYSLVRPARLTKGPEIKTRPCGRGGPSSPVPILAITPLDERSPMARLSPKSRKLAAGSGDAGICVVRGLSMVERVPLLRMPSA